MSIVSGLVTSAWLAKYGKERVNYEERWEKDCVRERAHLSLLQTNRQLSHVSSAILNTVVHDKSFGDLPLHLPSFARFEKKREKRKTDEKKRRKLRTVWRRESHRRVPSFRIRVSTYTHISMKPPMAKCVFASPPRSIDEIAKVTNAGESAAPSLVCVCVCAVRSVWMLHSSVPKDIREWLSLTRPDIYVQIPASVLMAREFPHSPFFSSNLREREITHTQCCSFSSRAKRYLVSRDVSTLVVN